MKKFQMSCVCIAVLLAQLSPAMAEDVQEASQVLEFKISRAGDLEMSCGTLSQEALTMRDIIYTTQDIKDASQMQSHGITAAGAVGSFLVGTVTGGLGLAAAGFLLEQNVDEKSDAADSVQDIAEQRRTLMMGIYNAKGCYGPLEHAMQSPEGQDVIEIAAVEPAAGEPATSETRQTKRRNKPKKPRYNN